VSRRQDLYPEIRRLREDEGLKWREIGERLGISLKTAFDYYNDPTGEKCEARKTASDERLHRSCPRCGSRMGPARAGAETCHPCYIAELHRARVARDEDIVLMWESGMSQVAIALELGYSANSCPPELSRLMHEGRIQARREGYRRRHELERAA
jgi:hypothetical protein